MDLENIKRNKRVLESEILKLIKEFEENTTTQVERIVLNKHHKLSGVTKIYSVRLEVHL